MSHDSEFTDYEPITRSGSPTLFGAEAADDGWIRQNPLKPQSRSSAPDQSSLKPRARGEWPAADPHKTKSQQGLKEHWLIKRGHAVSYAGLFLFTALVYLRPYELLPSLSWLSGSPFWVALVTMIVFVPTQLGLEGKLTIRPREVNLAFILLLTGLLSVPRALEPLRAWSSFVDYLKVVLMFVVLVNVVRTEGRLKSLFLLVFFASCVMSLAALNDYRLGNLALAGRRIEGIIGGMFDNPNDLALHLVTMIPIAVGLLFASRRPLKKVVYCGCVVLMTAGVVVTFSRGGFLGLAFAGSFFAWRIVRRNKFLVAILAPMAVGLFVLFAPGGYGNRLSTTSDDSALARRDDLKRSLFVAAHHPVFGVGINNYILFSNENKSTHNAYTQVAAETGFPALIVYLLFLITPLKSLRKIASETSSARRTSRYYYLAVGLEASLIGYMVTSFFASVAYLWYVYYIVGYSICLQRLYASSQVCQQSGVAVVQDSKC